MSKIQVIVAGISFSSLMEAATYFNQNYFNVARRIRSGWTPEEALGILPHKIKRPNKGNRITTSVGTFDSIADAAEHFGIEGGTIQKRLSMGWTPDQAVGIESHSKKPKRTREISCAGNTYPNSWAMAQAYGKKEKLVAKRLRLGWTPEQAVEIEEAPPRFRNQPKGATNKHWKKIEIVDNKEYPATEEGEYKLYLITNEVDGKQYVGITINPLWQRFNGHKRSAKTGVKTKLYNAMRHHGIENFSIALIRADARSFVELQQQEIEEINKRDTIEAGYNVSPGGSIGTPDRITIGGVTFSSRGAAAEYFGISVGVFNLRLGRLKWTPEQAAEIEPRKKYSRNRITAGGVTYPSIKQAAEAHGLDYKLVWDRIKSKGWKVEEALGLIPPPASARCAGVEVLVFGQFFSTLKACAESYGIKAETLRARIRKGMAVEDAIISIQSRAHRINP